MAVKLKFEGIRCFSKPQEALLRPLTILVGENGSGKTTFLAICQVASAIVRGYESPYPFNVDPFRLGAFDQIASRQNGRGQARTFSIEILDSGEPISITAEFISKGGQPALRTRTTRTAGKSWTVGLANLMGPRLQPKELELWRSAEHKLWKSFGLDTYALAPVRSNPKRTYDPVSAEPEPEGSHVPMLLARLARARGKTPWTSLKTALNQFGAKSGLFKQLDVVRKGSNESDPFQISVKASGPTANLVDVGYGVSQALPILVDVLQRAAEDRVILLQQPEVHLHPKAQAQMGSFFAQQAAKNRRFVIETHSDYLVDRVRMEIRRGTLKPEQVSLLYFEMGKDGATIHNIELGPDGSVVDPPAGYRQFFLDEERALLDI